MMAVVSGKSEPALGVGTQVLLAPQMSMVHTVANLVDYWRVVEEVRYLILVFIKQEPNPQKDQL